MANIQSFVQEHISPLAMRISDSKFITCLMSGFSSILGIILIGSIASLITGFQYFGVADFLAATGVGTYLSLISTFTTGCISLFLAVSIAHAVARRDFDETESRIVSFITLIAFLIVSPLIATEDGATGVSTTLLGARGMFVAIIFAYLMPWIYRLFVQHNILVHMPESVPPFIEKSFKSLVPGAAIFVLAAGIAFGFGQTEWGSIHTFIYSILAAPFAAISGNIFGYVLITFLIQLFWFFGIHGGMTFDAIKNMLFTQAAMENIAAYGAGDAMPNIVTLGFSDLAGSGTAQGLGLLICLIFFCKRADFKAIAKVGFVPQIFGITEPIRFGVPTVFNISLMIPLLLFQPLLELLAYACCSIGILSFPRVGLIRGVPFLLTGFMEGGVSGVVFQIVAVVLAVLFFLPFVKMYERQRDAEDAKRAETAV